ncbi:carbohydrate ABC transporter permease [Xylanivirga thermophila]|uniref:carbohydrate ABC transporter permease n=1 Tax=Xylanivirga thermophila TaxID=2496273 RepID=UPI001A912DE0|nr:sugar ABC transporter permease [Xylanivirga thermophila]
MDVKSKNEGCSFSKRDAIGFLFVLPMLFGIFLFVIYPMIASLIFSFQQTNGVSGTWVGVSNYRSILTDSVFWKSLYNTVYMGIFALLLDICISFILASLINNVKWGKNFFKSVYFLPNVVSVVATSILFSFLFYPNEVGLMNFFLGKFGIKPVGWFTNPSYAKWGIILMSLWRSIGYDSIIFLAGLQSVPNELYEAAEVDGATGLKKWWHITIPSMRPIFVFMIMIGTINAMKRFGDVWMIGGTAGNPSGSLLTVVLYIYRNAFMAAQVGIASAAAYVLFVIILLLTILNNKFLNKDTSLY